MSTYRHWLLAQLRFAENIDAHPEPQVQHFDDLRQVIAEASKRAAAAGLPDAVKACKIRRGAISAGIAREVLARCLAAVPGKSQVKKERLTPPQVAKRYGVSADTVRQWIETGELRAANVAAPGTKRPRYRIEASALADFDKRRTAEAKPPTPRQRRRKKTALRVTRYSASQ
jgi:excisionase family DNA binding protein